jgi:hypothetical protein
MITLITVSFHIVKPKKYYRFAKIISTCTGQAHAKARWKQFAFCFLSAISENSFREGEPIQIALASLSS